MAGAIHEALNPIQWLIGSWKSVSAQGSYPTIAPFTYIEELSFASLGQPLLNYQSTTRHPEKSTPMHLESGFLRVKPGTNEVAFMVAHNFGLTTLEEGLISGNTVRVKTKDIARMTWAKEPKVLAIERCWKLNEKQQLECEVFMETDKTPLTLHLKVIYQKYN